MVKTFFLEYCFPIVYAPYSALPANQVILIFCQKIFLAPMIWRGTAKSPKFESLTL
jgi:hypothetical protein